MDENNQIATPEVVSYDATVVAPKYDEAVANRDVASLKQAAKDNIDNEASGVFMKAAGIIERNTKEFANVVAPIEKAGGMATPDGHIAIAKQFETVADRPNWGTALLKYVMGDKDGAVKQITGGDIKTRITYDNNGNQIEEKFNELGEPLSYMDRKTGQMMSKEEYAQRVGGISSWANTLYGMTETERRKQNLNTEQEENASTNHWFALTQNHKNSWKQILGTLQQVKSDISPELYSQIIQNVTSSAGAASSQSRSQMVLSQLTEAANKGNGYKISDTLAAQIGGKGKILNVQGDRIVSTDGSFNKSISDLKSQQSSESQNAEQTKNLASTRESIMTAARLNQLVDKSGKSVDPQRLLFVLDTAQRIGKETQAAIDKYGKPDFISPPSVSNVFDTQAQMMAQAMQGMHNADQMAIYKGYRDDALQGYRKNNILPTAGEIAAGYTKTGGFKELQDLYAQEIGNVLSKSFAKPEPAKAAPAKPTAKPAPAGGPAVPPAQNKKQLKSLADIAEGK